jgi:2-polyprenyl-3-methyl-5-hydroxy-6-metoxy-1,4-benzoquinol methylase
MQDDISLKRVFLIAFMKISLLQRILSRLVPVTIRTFPGKTSPHLKLYLFRGRWQLASETALYSDGAAYTPLLLAFRALRAQVNNANNMLVLGAGLGSAISVIEGLALKVPDTVLVDIDPAIIDLAKELLPHNNLQWYCSDVRAFIASETRQFDLIVLDVFQDRLVPQFVCSRQFLEQCAATMHPGGMLVFNYIINNEESWKELQQLLPTIFRVKQIIPIRINRILLLEKAAD